MRILLVEDDTEAASYLVKGLTESGHTVEHAADGDKGLQLASDNAYDSMIIDRMLPKRDGLSLIEEIRRNGNNTPVLILSALDDVDERVTGLKAGGDDYLTKPYSLSELTARLQALTRRAQSGASGTVLRVGDLTLDLIKQPKAKLNMMKRVVEALRFGIETEQAVSDFRTDISPARLANTITCPQRFKSGFWIEYRRLGIHVSHTAHKILKHPGAYYTIVTH